MVSVTCNTDDEQNFINTFYPTTPNISIDYAIMEKADNIYTMPCDCGWSDLGTWASLFLESEKDKNNNVIQGNRIYTSETTNSIIRAPKNKIVVVKGLDDFIIVDENDVLLIYPKSKEQEIKQISQIKLLIRYIIPNLLRNNTINNSNYK